MMRFIAKRDTPGSITARLLYGWYNNTTVLINIDANGNIILYSQAAADSKTITAQCSAGNDTGTVALINLVARRDTPAILTARDILSIKNNTFEHLRMKNDGNIELAAGGITTLTGAGAFAAGIDPGNIGVRYKFKKINTGAWNMDTTPGISIAHGLADHTKIRNIFVTISNGAGTLWFPLSKTNDAADPNLIEGGIASFDATNIVLSRRTGGYFDNVLYGTALGYIYIIYEV